MITYKYVFLALLIVGLAGAVWFGSVSMSTTPAPLTTTPATPENQLMVDTDHKAEILAEIAGLTGPEIALLSKSEIEYYLTKLSYGELLEAFEGTNGMSCHDPAHIIGSIAYSDTQSIPESLSVCTEQCMSGCIHGALLQAVKGVTASTEEYAHISVNDIAGEMATMCETDGNNPSLEGNCIHGIGHAVMSLSTTTEAGIAHCNVYPEGPKRYYCQTGVFMEIMHMTAVDWDAAAPLYPCTLPGVYLSACMRYQTGIISGSIPGVNMKDYCDSLSPRNMRVGCYHGLGRISAVKEGVYTIQDCVSEDAIATRSCIESAAESWYTGVSHDVQPLCSQLQDTPELAVLCTQHAQKNLYFSLDKDFSIYLDEY